jgi:exopolysaccharide production protein ExoQ
MSRAATGRAAQQARRVPAFRPASTPVSRPSPVKSWLTWLAPFVAVAVVAYPSLIWSLTEAEVVDVGPMLLPAAPDGPPSVILRIYFPLLLLAGVAVFVAHWQALRANGWTIARTGLLHPALLFAGLFVGFALLSHTWAVDPALSFRRCVLVTIIAAAVVAAVLATDDWVRLLDGLFWWFALVVVLNGFAVLTKPPTALGHAGVYPHKNYLGAVASMIALTAVHQLFIQYPAARTDAHLGTLPLRRPLTRVAALIMVLASLWFLVAAKSKTSLALSIVAPAIGFGFACLARYLRLSPALTVPAVFGSVYFIYAFGAASGFWDFQAMATLIFGDPTLTQRTDIWAFAFRMMPGHLTSGFGYEGFWGAGPESPSIRAGGPGFVAQMPHGHNGYIDVVLQTGFIGLTLIGGMLLAALHVAGRVARTSLSLSSFALSYIVFCLLYNLFESTFFRSFNIQHMMLMTVIALSATHDAAYRSAKRARLRA